MSQTRHFWRLESSGTTAAALDHVLPGKRFVGRGRRLSLLWAFPQVGVARDGGGPRDVCVFPIIFPSRDSFAEILAFVVTVVSVFFLRGSHKDCYDERRIEERHRVLLHATEATTTTLLPPTTTQG